MSKNLYVLFLVLIIIVMPISVSATELPTGIAISKPDELNLKYQIKQVPLPLQGDTVGLSRAYKIEFILGEEKPAANMPLTVTLDYTNPPSGDDEYRVAVYAEFQDTEKSYCSEMPTKLKDDKATADLFSSCTIFVGASIVPPKTKLTDIKTHWAKDAIEDAVLFHGIKGFEDNTFRPNMTITRAEMSVLLVKYLNAPIQYGKMFKDTDNHWANNYIFTVHANGLMRGYTWEYFKPDDSLTREQLAVIACKLLHINPGVKNQTAFIDSDQISPSLLSYVQSAAQLNLMKGDNGYFYPKRQVTRAEAVQFLYNYQQLIKEGVH